MDRPLVISAPEPRTLDLIFDPPALATLRDRYRLVETDAASVEITSVHLTVEVLPTHRVSRWSWHLIDRRDGSRFETGLDYDSPSAARRAGLSRLAELASPMRAPRVVVISSGSRLRAA